jgi:hypothetical protein
MALLHALYVVARDIGRSQFGPARQEVLADEIIGLLPTAVLLPGVLEVAASQVGEGPGITLGSLLGLRVLAPGDIMHDVLGQRARLGEADRIAVGKVVPPYAIMQAVDAFPRFVTVGTDLQGEALLLQVPHQERLRLRPQLLQVQLSERTLVGRTRH